MPYPYRALEAAVPWGGVPARHCPLYTHPGRLLGVLQVWFLKVSAPFRSKFRDGNAVPRLSV